LLTIIERLGRDQHEVVHAAADFADSDEWLSLGISSPAHWIAAAADIEVSTAREWIRVGRCLRTLPATARAFAAGTVSYSKIRTITRFATADNEAELLDLAIETPAGRLGRAVAAWLERTSEADELARHQENSRSCSWRSEPDGMTVFTVRLPPLPAGVLIARLEREVMRAKPASDSRPGPRSDNGAGPRPENESEPNSGWPSLAQQYADAVHRLARASGGEDDATLEVLLHVRGDGCTLDDGTPIADSVVERVAPTAFVRALIHDADGRPINASSRQRHPTARQKRVVKERDRRCIDCGAESLLEYDHVPDYELTGRTLVEELQLRCAPCHARRHGSNGVRSPARRRARRSDATPGRRLI
jgi:hypothetical protein